MAGPPYRHGARPSAPDAARRAMRNWGLAAAVRRGSATAGPNAYGSRYRRPPGIAGAIRAGWRWLRLPCEPARLHPTAGSDCQHFHQLGQMGFRAWSGWVSKCSHRATTGRVPAGLRHSSIRRSVAGDSPFGHGTLDLRPATARELLQRRSVTCVANAGKQQAAPRWRAAGEGAVLGQQTVSSATCVSPDRRYVWKLDAQGQSCGGLRQRQLAGGESIRRHRGRPVPSGPRAHLGAFARISMSWVLPGMGSTSEPVASACRAKAASCGAVGTHRRRSDGPWRFQAFAMSKWQPCLASDAPVDKAAKETDCRRAKSSRPADAEALRAGSGSYRALCCACASGVPDAASAASTARHAARHKATQKPERNGNQGQVQRHVHPVGRPEPGDRALVVPASSAMATARQTDPSTTRRRAFSVSTPRLAARRTVVRKRSACLPFRVRPYADWPESAAAAPGAIWVHAASVRQSILLGKGACSAQVGARRFPLARQQARRA